mgnify:FL=1
MDWQLWKSLGKSHGRPSFHSSFLLDSTAESNRLLPIVSQHARWGNPAHGAPFPGASVSEFRCTACGGTLLLQIPYPRSCLFRTEPGGAVASRHSPPETPPAKPESESDSSDWPAISTREDADAPTVPEQEKTVLTRRSQLGFSTDKLLTPGACQPAFLLLVRRFYAIIWRRRLSLEE